MTQSSPVDYHYVKWCYDRPVSRSELREANKSAKTLTGTIAQSLIFSLSLYFGAEGLTVSHFLVVQTSLAPEAILSVN